MTLKSGSSENSHVARQTVLKLYKNRGETPLECLERFKKDNPEYEEVGPQGTLVRHDFAKSKMTYAGRLDPLAEGVLLVLVGEECKNKEKYLELDKEYEVDVLFGFSTDTHDILGIVIPAKAGIQTDIINLDSRLHGNDIQKVLQSFVGKFSQKYPQYSSINIKKILKARNVVGECLCEQSEAIQADKDVEIKSIEFLGERMISKSDLEKYIKESIALVKGDFRQKEILAVWKKTISQYSKHSNILENVGMFPVLSIRVNCTSGTYMRSLANSIGEKVGVPALALNIKRTKIGNSLSYLR